MRGFAGAVPWNFELGHHSEIPAESSVIPCVFLCENVRCAHQHKPATPETVLSATSLNHTDTCSNRHVVWPEEPRAPDSSASSSERTPFNRIPIEKLFSEERQAVLTLSETCLRAGRRRRTAGPGMRDASEGSRQDPSLAFRRSMSFPSAQTAVTCSAAETSAIIAISHPLKTAKPAVTNTRIFTMDSFPRDREPVEHLDRRT